MLRGSEHGQLMPQSGLLDFVSILKIVIHKYNHDITKKR